MLIGRRAGRLNQEHIGATDVLADLDKHLAIRKPGDLGGRQRQVERSADLLSELSVGASAQDLDVLLARHSKHLPSRGFPRESGGWGARIRTWECWNQNPVPCQLG